MPLLYMVPSLEFYSWLLEFRELAQDPRNHFFANNNVLRSQVEWQVGHTLEMISPVTMYVNVTYTPIRKFDILVPEPREDCIITCVMDYFRPEDYPYNLVFRETMKT